MMLVLETLTPLERAVFVLHEVFGFPTTRSLRPSTHRRPRCGRSRTGPDPTCGPGACPTPRPHRARRRSRTLHGRGLHRGPAGPDGRAGPRRRAAVRRRRQGQGGDASGGHRRPRRPPADRFARQDMAGEHPRSRCTEPAMVNGRSGRTALRTTTSWTRWRTVEIEGDRIVRRLPRQEPRQGAGGAVAQRLQPARLTAPGRCCLRVFCWTPPGRTSVRRSPVTSRARCPDVARSPHDRQFFVYPTRQSQIHSVTLRGTWADSPALARNELADLHAWWRAANYLAVGQIYLLDNPLLRRDLVARGRQTPTARAIGAPPRA